MEIVSLLRASMWATSGGYQGEEDRLGAEGGEEEWRKCDLGIAIAWGKDMCLCICRLANTMMDE